MLQHVGGEHDVKITAHLGRDSLTQVSLDERARAVGDSGQLRHIDSGHLMAHFEEPFGQTSARTAEIEDLAGRMRTHRVEIRPWELSSLGLNWYSSFSAMPVPSPNPAFCSRYFTTSFATSIAYPMPST